MKAYAVYIMASASGVLYTGVTNDLERRVFEHKSGRVPGFSLRYKTKKLVYFEVFGDVRAAIAREKELKGWLRNKKVALIESMNREWKDLSERSSVQPPPRPSLPRPPLAQGKGGGA
jgi:putative endonuclease